MWGNFKFLGNSILFEDMTLRVMFAILKINEAIFNGKKKNVKSL